MMMEDEEESGQAHELREIEPNTWSNGHLHWDFHRTQWVMRYATTDRNGKTLGRIRWNPVWNEFVFTPEAGLVLAHDCMTDLSNLLKILTERHHVPTYH